VGQVRECAARLMRFAKETGPAVLLVGHVTKGGGIAGPKTLEHIVDTVLYFEGETTLDHRILRAVKNRFGSVDEIGVFEMTGAGLVPVADPAAAFLAGRTTGVSGSAVTALMEGTRPLLVEIQAWAAKSVRSPPSSGGSARRRVRGSGACFSPRAPGSRRPGSRWWGWTGSVSSRGGSRPDVGVVVVAAGAGVRAGPPADEPKQFRSILGVPMLLRALRPFTSHPDVALVVIAVPPRVAARPPEWLATLVGERLALVAGGASRAQS